MRKFFALVLLFAGCAFAQELVDVDVSKFPPNIVRKSSTTENKIPKVNSTTNTLVNSSITDDGTTVTTTEPVVIDSDTSTLKLGDAQDVQLGRAASATLGIGNGTNSPIRITTGGNIAGSATAAPTAHGTDAAVRTGGTTVTIETTAAHGLSVGETVTLAGFTMATDAINGTWVIASVPTTTTFTIASPGTNETSSASGTITPLSKVMLGTLPTGSGVTTYPVGIEGVGFSAGTMLRANPTQAVGATAGNSVTIQGSPAIAGTSTVGAAAGGSVNITAGAAARLTSGNANGGDVILTPGAGIGTGTRGTVQCLGSGTGSTVIGQTASCSSAHGVVIGTSASSTNNYTVAVGYFASATAATSVAIGGGVSVASISRISDTVNISKINIVRKDNGENFNSTSSFVALYAGAPTVLFTNELDTTQAALTNTSQNWTVAVSSNVVTVNTITAHKFSVGQYFSTDADWTANAFMASLTDQLITSVTSTTFTFAKTQANQAATTETNAGAGLTPGDYVITLPTGGTFFVDEIGVVATLITGAITTHPTIQFGNSGDRDAFYAPALLTQTTATRTREKLTPIAVYAGQTTLSAGMTVASTVATAYKIRFYWKGIFVEDE